MFSLLVGMYPCNTQAHRFVDQVPYVKAATVEDSDSCVRPMTARFE